MPYNFDEIISRRDTHSAKWEFYHLLNPKADENTIPLWVADMDFPCSDEIVDALHRRVDRRIFGYSAHMTGEFFRAVCGWYQHRFNWYIDSKDILVSFGVVSALGCLIKILTEPGDSILIQQPVYYPFMNMIANNGRVVVANQLVNTGNGYYTIDFADFEEKASRPETKLFILCSPHNPVGRVWTVEELRRMTEICVRNGVKIVSDEIHGDLTRRGIQHYPLPVAAPEYREHMIICTAPSKTFNIAGLHASYIVCPDEEVRKQWKTVMTKQMGLDMMASLSITATEAAYYESEDWLEEVRAYLDENLAFMKEYLTRNAPLVKFWIPEATYLTWLDVREYGVDSQTLWNELASEGKVLLESGTLFGESGNGFIRMNAASPRPILQEALRRFVSIVNRVRLGAAVPDFTAFSRDGQTVKAYELFRAQEKTLLCFLRYAGYTVCQYDIWEIARLYEDLQKKGITPVVVLQSSQENAESLGELPYLVLCDPEGGLYRQYSISATVTLKSLITPKAMGRVEKAVQMGLQHGKYEGEEKQLPALFVVDRDGIAQYANYPSDIDIAPALEEVLHIF